MRTITLTIASLIALAGPLAAAENSAPPDCRSLQPDQCVKTCGCMFIEHAAKFPCRNLGERVRWDELFDKRATMVIPGKCGPPSNRPKPKLAASKPAWLSSGIICGVRREGEEPWNVPGYPWVAPPLPCN